MCLLGRLLIQVQILLSDLTGGGVDVVYDPVGMIIPSLKVS